ncbi:MAG: prephenate dehydrogenase/arogenate dehydrogenase family protein [Candidatus Helarchaeota archaeon]|nr:prephenate dehydrogenase/arogenate dehydrogenase family protein [Candidatus Helarchaeota archaeon]
MNSSFETFFKQLKISIIGGTGGMGRIFVRSLKDITNVMICSRDLKKAKSVAKQIGENIESGLLEDCYNSDIVVVSVPLENIIEICSRVIKIMKKGSLLIDLSSVKSGFINKLEIPDSIEYLSAHFLFGPQGDFSGENIILIPVKGKQWIPKIKYLFEKLGSNVFIISNSEHDIKMSKIQSLFHFTILCMVIAMAKSNIEPNFYTRSFKMMIPNIKNLLINLDVIFEIQKNNPFSQKQRKFFAELVNEISNLDHKEFEKLVRKSLENLKI